MQNMLCTDVNLPSENWILVAASKIFSHRHQKLAIWCHWHRPISLQGGSGANRGVNECLKHWGRNHQHIPPQQKITHDRNTKGHELWPLNWRGIFHCGRRLRSSKTDWLFWEATRRCSWGATGSLPRLHNPVFFRLPGWFSRQLEWCTKILETQHTFHQSAKGNPVRNHCDVRNLLYNCVNTVLAYLCFLCFASLVTARIPWSELPNAAPSVPSWLVRANSHKNKNAYH